jgi:biopolymer transport protein ExbB/TolQ
MDIVMRFAGADIIQGQTAIFAGLLVYAPLRSFISARDHARALQYLHGIHDANAVRAEAVLRRVEAAEANRLAPLGFCIWVLPVTGFIGTVVGVSGAIGPLSELGSPTGGTNLAPKILAELRYAFDTTLVGLLYVLPAMLIQLAAQADTRKAVADLAIQVDRTLMAGS